MHGRGRRNRSIRRPSINLNYINKSSPLLYICNIGASWRVPPADGQALDDARSVCFTSTPLDRNRHVLGPGAVSLTLSSDRPMALVAVRVCEVDMVV